MDSHLLYIIIGMRNWFFPPKRAEFSTSLTSESKAAIVVLFSSLSYLQLVNYVSKERWFKVP